MLDWDWDTAESHHLVTVHVSNFQALPGTTEAVYIDSLRVLLLTLPSNYDWSLDHCCVRRENHLFILL